jgi:hypothetical protein
MSDYESETQADMGGAPPSDPPQIELDTPPPGWPKVVGIISIVWGALGLTCSVLGIGSFIVTPMFADQIAEQLGTAEPPPSMVFGAVDYAIVAFGLVVSVILLIAGIATVSRKESGRTLHIVYAFLGILNAAISVVYQIQNHNEVKAWAEQNIDDQAVAQSMSNEIGLFIGIGLALVLGLAWPIFCVIWFGALGKRPEVGKPDYI